MFRCPDCNQVSKPGEKQSRVITQARAKTYQAVNPRTLQTQVVGEGNEIVSEKAVCRECAPKPEIQ